MSNAPVKEQALCCHCGTMRTVGPTQPGRTGDPNGFGVGEAVAAWMTERGFDPMARCVCRAKCQTCGKVTGHAYLRSDPHRDHLEHHLYGTAEVSGP